MFLFPYERELWCEGNRWDGGDWEGVTTWMQPVGTIAVSTCISSLSGNISLVLLSAIKALSNLGWLVGVSRWWGVGWCMSRRSWCMMSREQTVDRLLYRPNPVWRASLQRQPARKRPTVFLQSYYLTRWETQNQSLFWTTNNKLSNYVFW